MQVLNLIIAVDTNRCIGKSGPVPLVWKQKEDMKRFKNLTTGNVVIMGANTFFSMGSKPLPNRTNIVVTKKNFAAISDIEGVDAVQSLDEAIEFAKEFGKEIFLIGGGMLYNEAIKRDLIKAYYITIFETQLPEDPTNSRVNFPVFYNNIWTREYLGDADADTKNEFYSVFVDIRRSNDV